jgi:hypothetical protein
VENCSEKLSDESSTNGGDKPNEQTEAKQPNATTKERHHRCEADNEKCGKQNRERRLTQLSPNEKTEPSPHGNEPTDILRRGNAAHPEPSMICLQIHSVVEV